MKTGWRTKTTLSVLRMCRITDSLKERVEHVFSMVIFSYLRGMPDQLSAYPCTNRPSGVSQTECRRKFCDQKGGRHRHTYAVARGYRCSVAQAPLPRQKTILRGPSRASSTKRLMASLSRRAGRPTAS